MIKNHFIFDPVQERQTNIKFYRLSAAKFYDCINTMYQFIKLFLDNKMPIFEEYGAFNKVIWAMNKNWLLKTLRRFFAAEMLRN